MKTIRIATRKSALALWQAEHVAQLLQAAHADISVQLIPLSTRGDKILDTPLAKIGGKGLFVKELETAMLQGDADLAVHSMKDVPMVLPAGLGIVAVLARHNPYDALVSNHYQNLKDLPHGARVGSSSLRRQVQLLAARADLNIVSLRGNVNTRLQKLDAGEFDAIVLAAAGLERLGLHARIAQILPPDLSLPAVGQGIIGIEARDTPTWQQLLAPLNDANSALCLAAERALNRTLNGGCQAPIAGFAYIENQQLILQALVGDLNGKIIQAQSALALSADASQNLQKATMLGQDLAQELLQNGAAAILAQLLG